MNKDIKIKYASYALADILYDLLNCGINHITITKEDNDSEIIITQDQLSRIRYGSKTFENNEALCVDKNTRDKFPNYDENHSYHTTYQCPNCGCTIHMDWHEQRNYCPECGVKIELPKDDE